MRGPFYVYSKNPIPNKRMQFKEIQITSSTNVIIANQKSTLTNQYAAQIT